jgi:hypothetical protein
MKSNREKFFLGHPVVNINNIKLLSFFQVLQSYAFYLHPLIHVLDFFAVLSLDSVFYFYFIR